MKSRLRFLFAKRKTRWAFGSWFLMQSEQIDYSHCAIEIDGFVYESVWPESRVVFLDDWLKKYEVVNQKVYDSDDMKIEMIRHDILSGYLGKTYSIFQLFLIGLGFLSSDLDSWVKKIHWNGSKFLICTELVAVMANKYFAVEFNEKLDTISLREAWDGVSKISEDS